MLFEVLAYASGYDPLNDAPLLIPIDSQPMHIGRLIVNFGRQRSLRFVVVLTLTLVGTLVIQTDASAQGRLHQQEAAGLSLRIDGRWTGGMYGGYWPLRITAKSLDEARDVTFRFEPIDDGQPIVERTVECHADKDMYFTLSIPLIGSQQRGELKIVIDGDEIDALETPVELPRTDWHTVPMPAMLVISDQQPALGQFQRGAGAYAMEDARSGHQPGELTGQAYVVRPNELPHSWVDFTALDMVCVSFKTLKALPEANREALRTWTRMGGNLIVHGVGADPAGSADFIKLLGMEHMADEAQWMKSDRRVRDGHIRFQGQNNNVVHGRRRNQFFNAPQTLNMIRNEDRMNPKNRWQQNDPFQVAFFGLGRVVGMEGEAFPGAALDWYWVTASLTQTKEVAGRNVQRSTWVSRNGHSARSPATDFTNFLIPGVDTVPIYPLLFLMSVFVIVIGPLNYWFCWKRKQLYLLMISIPTIALVTSLVLFGYSAISHGFGALQRVHSFTLLDQRSHEAVSLSRVSVYSGVTPSGGVSVSPETGVFPMLNRDQSFTSGELEWTADNQHMKSGWVNSRSTCQFRIGTPRTISEGLEIDKASVRNGFKWGIAHLAVAAEDGKLYYAADIGPGESASLNELTALEGSFMSQALTETPEGLPDNIQQRRSIFDEFAPRNRRWARQTSMNESILHANIDVLTRLGIHGGQKGKRGYVAILSENPGIETGLPDAEEAGSLHVVRGIY